MQQSSSPSAADSSPSLSKPILPSLTIANKLLLSIPLTAMELIHHKNMEVFDSPVRTSAQLNLCVSHVEDQAQLLLHLHKNLSFSFPQDVRPTPDMFPKDHRDHEGLEGISVTSIASSSLISLSKKSVYQADLLGTQSPALLQGSLLPGSSIFRNSLKMNKSSPSYKDIPSFKGAEKAIATIFRAILMKWKLQSCISRLGISVAHLFYHPKRALYIAKQEGASTIVLQTLSAVCLFVSSNGYQNKQALAEILKTSKGKVLSSDFASLSVITLLLRPLLADLQILQIAKDFPLHPQIPFLLHLIPSSCQTKIPVLLKTLDRKSPRALIAWIKEMERVSLVLVAASQNKEFSPISWSATIYNFLTCKSDSAFPVISHQATSIWVGISPQSAYTALIALAEKDIFLHQLNFSCVLVQLLRDQISMAICLTIPRIDRQSKGQFFSTSDSLTKASWKGQGRRTIIGLSSQTSRDIINNTLIQMFTPSHLSQAVSRFQSLKGEMLITYLDEDISPSDYLQIWKAHLVSSFLQGVIFSSNLVPVSSVVRKIVPEFHREFFIASKIFLRDNKDISNAAKSYFANSSQSILFQLKKAEKSFSQEQLRCMTSAVSAEAKFQLLAKKIFQFNVKRLFTQGVTWNVNLVQHTPSTSSFLDKSKVLIHDKIQKYHTFFSCSGGNLYSETLSFQTTRLLDTFLSPPHCCEHLSTIMSYLGRLNRTDSSSTDRLLAQSLTKLTMFYQGMDIQDPSSRGYYYFQTLASICANTVIALYPPRTYVPLRQMLAQDLRICAPQLYEYDEAADLQALETPRGVSRLPYTKQKNHLSRKPPRPICIMDDGDWEDKEEKEVQNNEMQEEKLDPHKQKLPTIAQFGLGTALPSGTPLQQKIPKP